MIEVVIDKDAGTVYVSIAPNALRAEPQNITHQWVKFNVLPHWDGHGGLLGIEFTDVANVLVRDATI